MVGARSEPGIVRTCRQASEGVMLAAACLAPWAFGAVDAWAELALDVAVVLIVVLGAVAGAFSRRSNAFVSVPGLALAGLALLALVQTLPLPEGVYRVVSPATSALRLNLSPTVPEEVLGDSGPPVALPALTLSEDPDASLRTAVRLAAAWLLFESVFGLERGFAAARRFGMMTAANATLMSLFSLVQMLTWNGKIFWFRPSPTGSAGPFVCHGHLAAYLNLGLGFVVGRLLSPDPQSTGSRRLGTHLWEAYAAGVIVVGILASLSRNGFLGLAVGLAVTLLLVRPGMIRLGVVLAAVAVLVPLLLYMVGSAVPYQERLATLLDSRPYQERVMIWLDALRAWPSHPILGAGLGSFAVAATRFFRRDVGVYYAHGENEYVEWLVDGGVVGVGLLLTFILGTAALARRAWRSAPSARDRGWILGAVFGAVALLVDSIGDFALHIPGVAVTVAILCAFLCKQGLEAAPAVATERDPGPGGLATIAPSLTRLALAVLVLLQGIGLARSEAAYRASGQALPGSAFPRGVPSENAVASLERLRESLERSLADRPNWAEGHQELGLTLLKLYAANVSESLRSEMPDEKQREAFASHLWLHGTIHAPSDRPAPTDEELLAMPQVRRYLVPAARAFLEARRCSPWLPIPHGELAALDYLLKGNEPGTRSLHRAFRLSGPDAPFLALLSQIALQNGDLGLVVRCLRKRLAVSDKGWEQVADYARVILPPDRILAEVVPDGPYAIRFAERLYTTMEKQPIRDRFLKEALRRLPTDPGLSEAQRCYFEARAWADLDDRAQARSRMKAALDLEPSNAAWRKELVDWCIGWGLLREAHDEALIGLHFTPRSAEARQSLERSAEALARGATASPATP